MAGQTMPTQWVVLSAAAQLSGIANGAGQFPPAGKCQSVSLCAALGTPGADAYLDVYVYTGGSGPLIIWQEPVRYNQPGGSPVLLLNYILQPSTYLVVSVQNSAVKDVHCCCFNRFMFDA